MSFDPADVGEEQNVHLYQGPRGCDTAHLGATLWGPLTRGQAHLTGPLRLCWSSPADVISSWDQDSEPLNWADLPKTSSHLQLECSSWKGNLMSYNFSLTSHNFWAHHPHSFVSSALGDLALPSLLLLHTCPSQTHLISPNISYRSYL